MAHAAWVLAGIRQLGGDVCTVHGLMYRQG